MPQDNKHQRALELVAENQPEEAVKLLAEALGENESADLWNDWASVKVALGENEDALVGFERAVELDGQNAQAAFNLGLLLVNEGRIARALPLLRKSVDKVGAAEQAAAAAIFAAHKGLSDASAESAASLDRFAPASGPTLEYFNTHRERYLNCLEMLPAAKPGQKLLELGASFHHLTPAFEDKGYAVRCADIWEGDPQRTAAIATADGTEKRSYVVDNFDLQQKVWPYKDEEFDAVIFCEILEHLNTDPMAVLGEINRILKKDGLLLLTTPNMASAKSVNYVLQGNSPYVFGHFVPGGLPTDRHNREYTATEVEHLLQAAGFELAALETHNSWWKDQNAALSRLVAGGLSVLHRGDNVFALGKKTSTVKDRFPEEFYCAEGSQAENRNQITGKKKNILVVHEVLPHFDRSGSDMRIMQVLRRLRAQGHEVTYIGRSEANHEKYEPALKELGITYFSGDSERLPAIGVETTSTWKLADVLRGGHFDLAIFFHWFWSGISVTEQYLDDIRRLSPQTRIAVLTDDRHGIREWRAAELSKLSVDYERALNFLVREAECYRAADLVLAITEDDRKGLVEMVPELDIELLPMIAETVDSKKGFADRKDFVFLANFDNLANCDASVWFCNEIWPRIRKRLPEAHLYLAGNNIPADYGKKPGIEVLGYVVDLPSTLERFRVFVSPIRFGTGIKTKNLTAMGNGIPLVTTTIGAEGMNLTDGEHAMICDAAGGFANRAVELYKDPELWQKLAENGRKHIETEFSVARLDSQIAKIVNAAVEIAPRAYDPEHRFSFRLVEELHPEVLTAQPAYTRQERRIFGYLEMAERLAKMGRPAESLEQARNIFPFFRGVVSRSLFLARILTLLESCYRETGDQEAAARCGAEAKLCLPELNPAFLMEVGKKGRAKTKPSDCAFSVIIPTYNRRAKLERCLEALSKQTLPADDFEVIVIDDGSTDDTQEFLSARKPAFRFSHFRQANQGAGAARKLGVDKARGEYLLLMNDDTIANPELLAEHLLTQCKYHSSCFAVLGTFEYERPARRRALTHYLNVDAFMFPQINMKPDFYYGHTHFITCNLSVRRDAVLAAGSFDPQFRMGEDTELGLRMAANGCKVVFNPQAKAFHDHLEMKIDDMVRRAKAYGPVYLRLLGKHPSLKITHPGLELSAPVTAADIEQMRETLAKQRPQIEETVRALRQYDNRDFEPAFAKRSGGGEGSAADMIVNLYRQAIPQVHWFYVFDGLCNAWTNQAQPAGEAALTGASA